MKLVLVFFFCFLMTPFLMAQVKFEEGYLVDLDGDTLRVFVEVQSWTKNPDEVIYRQNAEATTERAGPATVQAFCVEGLKFASKVIEVDITPEDVREVGNSLDAKIVRRNVFLKVLVEGEATLYLYDDNRRRKFYYSVGEGEVTPLVYRRLAYSGETVRENNSYQTQLNHVVNCNKTQKEVENVDYNLNSLVRYFQEYNECKGTAQMSYLRNNRFKQFHVYLKGAVGMMSADLLILSRRSNSFETEISGEPLYSFGLESEYSWSSKKKRFSVILSAGYQQFTFEDLRATDSLSMEGKFIQIGVGTRYSIHFNESARWFASAGYAHYLSAGAGYTYRDDEFLRNPSDVEFDLNSGPGYFLGTGVELRNRFLVQVRYDARIEKENDYVLRNPTFSTFSIDLGYRLFQMPA